jgi:hypothetical protein
MVQEARDHHADGLIMAAARRMHSELRVLDCERRGRRVHWVTGEGCALGHWAPRRAGARRSPAEHPLIGPLSLSGRLANSPGPENACFPLWNQLEHKHNNVVRSEPQLHLAAHVLEVFRSSRHRKSDD